MIIILSLLIDRWWGEPPARIHPVIWMGHYLKRAGRDLPDHGPHAAFLLGAVLWIAGAAAVAVLYGYADLATAELPVWLDILVTALLLKPLLALRMLLGEVQAVEESLGRGLECGRARLRMIVSRDTAELDSTRYGNPHWNRSPRICRFGGGAAFLVCSLRITRRGGISICQYGGRHVGYRGRWEWAGNSRPAWTIFSISSRRA